MPEQADWVRVGQYLQEQRVRLDPRYRSRSAFSRDRGINERLAQDIENAARVNFTRPTITHIELAYGLEPGTVDKLLHGERPDALPPLVAENWGDPKVRQLWSLPTFDMESRLGLVVRYLQMEGGNGEEAERRRA